tara:strand:- start:1999 stop:2388 length:390 start_codon:yes stop_codon:yes gene_type:complete
LNIYKALNSKNKKFYLINSFVFLYEYIIFNLLSFENIIKRVEKISLSKHSNLEPLRLVRLSNKLLDLYKIKSCFLRSIIIFRVLKNNGISSKLHIGVKKIRELEAHAWIELDGKFLDSDKGYQTFTFIE